MRNLLIAAAAAVCVLNVRGEFASHEAPRPEKRPRDVSMHGDKRTDDYFWLREKDNPAVLAHLKAENEHTESVLAPAAKLRESLYGEMVARLKETDSSAPATFKGWLWYERTEKGKQHPIYCRRKDAPDAAEQIVVDVNKLAEGNEYTSLAHYQISTAGTRLLYSIDWTGYRQYEVFIIDLATMQPVPQKIEKVAGVTWAGDDDTIYYTTENEAKRADKLWRLHLTTGQREMLYEEKDQLFDLSVSLSADRRFVFCSSNSKKTAEVRAVPAHQPDGKLTMLLSRSPDHDYSVEHRDGRFYFVTNRDAKNYRLVSAPVAKPDEWTEVLPHIPAVKVDGLVMFADFMAVLEREGGLPQIRLYDFAAGKSHRLNMPEAAYDVGPETNPAFEAQEFRYRYESMVTPLSVRAVNGLTGEQRTLKAKEVPGYDRTKYKTERLTAAGTDGVKIPISIVYRADLDRRKPQPLHLSGYGSYGISETASFSSTHVSLLDRGLIVATAHVRGGGEMGEEWRDAGRMAKKMTTFTDFVSCAEFFVKQRWTTPEQLVISGGSAGGMLVGAVLNLRPDLFRAALLDVPFVDVLNTMLDDTIPLTTSEYVEWGNPNLKEQYAWMRAYSPYDNLSPAAYPHVLVNAGLNDSQVPYWEGAKYAARLRDVRRDKNVTLLHCEMGAGHGGVSGRYDALKEYARNYAFLLTALGMAGNTPTPDNHRAQSRARPASK
jgi:oligopeptidase B